MDWAYEVCAGLMCSSCRIQRTTTSFVITEVNPAPKNTIRDTCALLDTCRFQTTVEFGFSLVLGRYRAQPRSQGHSSKGMRGCVAGDLWWAHTWCACCFEVDARSQPRSPGLSSSRHLDPGSLFRSSGREEERPWKRGWIGQSETIFDKIFVSSNIYRQQVVSNFNERLKSRRITRSRRRLGRQLTDFISIILFPKQKIGKDESSQIYVLSVTVLTLWVAPPEMFSSWYRI